MKPGKETSDWNVTSEVISFKWLLKSLTNLDRVVGEHQGRRRASGGWHKTELQGPEPLQAGRCPWSGWLCGYEGSPARQALQPPHPKFCACSSGGGGAGARPLWPLIGCLHFAFTFREAQCSCEVTLLEQLTFFRWRVIWWKAKLIDLILPYFSSAEWNFLSNKLVIVVL